MDKKTVAIILIVTAVVLLAVSAIVVFSFDGAGDYLKSSYGSQRTSAGQIQLLVEGNEFGEATG